ncbi:MAG TPA: CoA pyrophosphatase [Gemmatimonadaceae bacterium]|nr:CoA pyrophosphatase [Gemmatimonadaceae bacterium]
MARPGALADAGPDVRRAAVALVLRPDPAGGLDLLFIRRAEYPGDPWSGQIAFPGGRQEPEDDTLRETAIRETREEVGLDLLAGGLVLGALDELHPRTPVLPPIVVRPYVFATGATAHLYPSDEVAAAFWVPLDALRAPDATFEATVVVRGEERRVPGLRHLEHVIWGMTERIFRDFLARLP